MILHDYCENDTGVLLLQVTKSKTSLVNYVTSAYLTHYKNMNAKHQISEYLLQQNVQNHLKGVETSKLSQYNTSFIKQNIGESNVRYLLFMWSKLILPYLLKKCKSIHFWLAQQQLSTLNHSDWTASSWEGAKQITDDICKVVIYINQQWPPKHKRILTLQELHYSHSQQIKGQSKNNI